MSKPKTNTVLSSPFKNPLNDCHLFLLAVRKMASIIILTRRHLVDM